MIITIIVAVLTAILLWKWQATSKTSSNSLFDEMKAEEEAATKKAEEEAAKKKKAEEEAAKRATARARQNERHFIPEPTFSLYGNRMLTK